RKADGMSPRLRGGRVVMMSMINEPDREAVREAWPQRGLYLGSIPVALPGEGIDVQQTLQQQHLAVNVPIRYRACRAGSRQGPDQDRPLWIKRTAVGGAELIPTIQIGSGNLMAVVSLQGQRPGVVDPHLIARSNVVEHRVVGGEREADGVAVD